MYCTGWMYYALPTKSRTLMCLEKKNNINNKHNNKEQQHSQHFYFHYFYFLFESNENRVWHV